jgi:two-component system, NtrC family, sensor kinase
LLVLLQMPIRKKILCGTLLLTCTLLLLMLSSLRGVYAYRQLAHMISQRAAELPTISKLQMEVDELRFSFRVSNPPQQRSLFFDQTSTVKNHERFLDNLDTVLKRLTSYEKQLQSSIEDDPLLADRSRESELVKRIRTKVEQIQRDRTSWELGFRPDFLLEQDLEELGQMVHKLPTFLQARMVNFREEVRDRYRTWIFFISVSATASFLILGIAYWFFRHSIVQPFKILLAGSRSIASGKFEHRIELQSPDELAELGNALNDMTTRFIEIRDTLNEKVQQRTSEVVRSEQLASVGFLAAGVAHEINNPLASIAWSAEALESRLHEILHCHAPDDGTPVGGYDQQELDVLRKYLKRIQDEAFRCKGITERLLDFSRLSESQRKQETDINESISDVVALVQHLGQYRNKRLEYSGQSGLTAWVSPPEFKQVVLNLLTNALDSLDDGGLVTVKLEHNRESFTLTVRDNGCGMTPEVKNHLFEPFFTRRRDGRGTGLGLSITYRIVQDHAGELIALSDGPGKGSTFLLKMPLEKSNSQAHETIKTAA